MKILLTVHQFFPEHCSGTEVLTFGVAKELLKRGHQVYVLTGFPAQKQLRDHDRFDEYDIEGIHVFRFHQAHVPMGGQTVVTEIEANNLLVARYFAGVVEKLKPDIIHFFHLSRLGAGLIDVAINAGIPAYYTPTDFWSICPTSQLLLEDGSMCKGPSRNGGNCVKHVAMRNRGPRVASFARWAPDMLVDIAVLAASAGLLGNRQLFKEIAAMGWRRNFIVSRLNALHGIFSPTKLMTEMLTANGVKNSQIIQSAYGIDVAGYSEKPRQRDSKKTLTFGFIGTLFPHKGCHILIEAVKKLDVKLKIYGNTAEFPDYFAELQNQAAGYDSIEFCGTFPNTAIVEVLAGIDALVVPSLWYENAPLVIYSALAAKCPVVVSNFSGMTEVVRNGWNGLLFTPGDVEALRSVLTRLIDEPDLLAALSSRCERPKSTAEYVDELLAAYERAHSGAPQIKKLKGIQDIQPLELLEEGHSYLSGWAVAGLDTPLKVSALVDNKPIAQINQFILRPDVARSLSNGGAKINASKFGFVLLLPAATQRSQVVLRLEARNGSVSEIPIESINCGNSKDLSNGHYLGLDDEHFAVEAL